MLTLETGGDFLFLEIFFCSNTLQVKANNILTAVQSFSSSMLRAKNLQTCIDIYRGRENEVKYVLIDIKGVFKTRTACKSAF